MILALQFVSGLAVNAKMTAATATLYLALPRDTETS